MKKMLMATTAAALLATNAYADAHSKDVKLGVIFGYTGPISAELRHNMLNRWNIIFPILPPFSFD